MILLFSLGSQFDHLIKSHIDYLGYQCQIVDPAKVKVQDVIEMKPKGIILSGGPISVYAEQCPFDNRIFDIGYPVLGICLGFQLWAQHKGFSVVQAANHEYGVHALTLDQPSLLFENIPLAVNVLQTHGDIVKPDSRLIILGSTPNCPVAAARYQHLWGVQFHPEVRETECGVRILNNFCQLICHDSSGASVNHVAKKVNALKSQVEGKKVLLALSGGSDSSVVAFLLKAAGSLTKGVYIKGIDRPDDEQHLKKYFANQDWISLAIVDATEEMLAALAGKKNSEQKREAVREVYLKVLEREIEGFKPDFIAQGTLYTDLSESGGGHATGARKAKIKQHHNTNLAFSIPEVTPLSDCVKDTARAIGAAVGVPDDLLYRHPFPGPGLTVRVEGEVTASKLQIAQQLDQIYIEELRKWGLYDQIWQSGVELTVSQTTHTKGDNAGVGSVAIIWAFSSINGFTAQAFELPAGFRRHVSRRITNEIRDISRVAVNQSDKPPATIEWE